MIVSNNNKVFEYCDRVLMLENGEIRYNGVYKDSPFFWEKGKKIIEIDEDKYSEREEENDFLEVRDILN